MIERFDLKETWKKALGDFKDKLKGGNNKMEVKSRYEVISDLEKQKRDLILERDSFKNKLDEMKKELKDLRREIEDKEEDVKKFEASIEERKETIRELIKSIDESLDRFVNINKSDSQKK